jgi:Fe2+ transport system protein FeoA
MITNNLFEAPDNIELKVKKISSAIESKRKLLSIGIRPDDFIIKLASPTIGAILVRNVSTGSTRLALGRGLARNIEVEYQS